MGDTVAMTEIPVEVVRDLRRRVERLCAEKADLSQALDISEKNLAEAIQAIARLQAEKETLSRWVMEYEANDRR
jgi:uncharacterized protein (UPF0335 family)